MVPVRRGGERVEDREGRLARARCAQHHQLPARIDAERFDQFVGERKLVGEVLPQGSAQRLPRAGHLAPPAGRPPAQPDGARLAQAAVADFVAPLREHLGPHPRQAVLDRGRVASLSQADRLVDGHGADVVCLDDVAADRAGDDVGRRPARCAGRGPDSADTVRAPPRPPEEIHPAPTTSTGFGARNGPGTMPTWWLVAPSSSTVTSAGGLLLRGAAGLDAFRGPGRRAVARQLPPRARRNAFPAQEYPAERGAGVVTDPHGDFLDAQRSVP